MANIMRLAMTEAVVANKNIDVKNKFFGIIKRAFYTPTLSPIDVRVKDLDTETGNRVKRLLDCADELLPSVLRSVGIVNESMVGNMRLETCVSRDGNFAAYQLFKFIDIDYRPITQVRVYEGPAAEMVSKVL
ncbi:MAG: hypothetical protein ACI308_07035 [Muribaculaceae bacterium]